MNEREPGLDSTGLFPEKEETPEGSQDFSEIVKHLKDIKVLLGDILTTLKRTGQGRTP